MQTQLLFLNMGGYEILLILLVILIFFGAKKIPELARGMGRGIREFKDATREIKDEIDEGINMDDSKPKAKANVNANTTTTKATSTNEN
jgi:sec-independent protein translocase protein TatA